MQRQIHDHPANIYATSLILLTFFKIAKLAIQVVRFFQ